MGLQPESCEGIGSKKIIMKMENSPVQKGAATGIEPAGFSSPVTAFQTGLLHDRAGNPVTFVDVGTDDELHRSVA